MNEKTRNALFAAFIIAVVLVAAWGINHVLSDQFRNARNEGKQACKNQILYEVMNMNVAHIDTYIDGVQVRFYLAPVQEDIALQLIKEPTIVLPA